MADIQKSLDGNTSLNEIIVVPDGKILDFIDGKLRNDTPEEYVRQNVEKRLIREHKYDRKQIMVEFPIKMGSGKKRADIVIFPEDSLHRQEFINIIIECKSEKVEPTDKKEGVEQLKSYMAASTSCEWGMWTNKKAKFVYRKISIPGIPIKWEEPNDIPSLDGTIEEIDRPLRDKLKKATEDNLLFTFKICHNHIYVNEGLQKQPAFFEFLKVIFCKIIDEKNIPNPLEFFASSREKTTIDGQLTVKKRISKIFDKVKQKYPIIFDKNDELNLKPRTLSYIVSELQKYSLLQTDIDVKGKAYEELVGSNLRGDRGEFFTPRNIVNMTVRMLYARLNDTFLDPACGTGGFLVAAMNNLISDFKGQNEESIKKKVNEWNDNEKSTYRERVQEIAKAQFFGFDLNPDLVKATKMNMVMNNDGSGNILQNDSLSPPHEWGDNIKNTLCDRFGLPRGSIRNQKNLALFDVVVTNPPFGTKLPVKDQVILEQFDLAYIWERTESGKLVRTDRLMSSRAPEVLFIERCVQFLKPGGKLAIVVPNSILSAPGIEYACVRTWILKNCNLVASIDLTSDTFQPHNGTSTSVLFLRKRDRIVAQRESQQGVSEDYNVFFALVDKVGWDKRGNKIFKRDAEGNELMKPDDDEKLIDQISSGQLLIQNIPKTKIVDDQTQDVAKTFLKWILKECLEW